MEDVKQLLTPLLSLLDGTHDVPFPKDKGKGNDLNYQINLLKNLSMIDFQFLNIKLRLQSLSYSSAFLLFCNICYLGYSKDSQKTVNQYRSTGRFEQSKEAEAVVNAKYQ